MNLGFEINGNNQEVPRQRPSVVTRLKITRRVPPRTRDSARHYQLPQKGVKFKFCYIPYTCGKQQRGGRSQKKKGTFALSYPLSHSRVDRQKPGGYSREVPPARSDPARARCGAKPAVTNGARGRDEPRGVLLEAVGPAKGPSGDACGLAGYVGSGSTRARQRRWSGKPTEHRGRQQFFESYGYTGDTLQ